MQPYFLTKNYFYKYFYKDILLQNFTKWHYDNWSNCTKTFTWKK